MIYQINERPPFTKLILFAFQMVLSVFVATVLIASICGVDISAGLVGAGLATLVYGIFTKQQSPMFISNSGAFVAPVIAALSLGGYTGIAIGGLTTCIIYLVFAGIFYKIDVNHIYKVFPASLIGSITAVIGLNLMGFIPTYVQVNGNASQWGMIIALITMSVIAIISHYAKGMIKVVPFLIGTLVGYFIAIILTLIGVCELVDFSVFNNLTIFCMPKFAFHQLNSISSTTIITIVITYVAYTISAMMECLSDHAALGNIVGVDLYRKPGLSRIFGAEGFANLVSSLVGGLGACSYGEGVACVGFSKVASRAVVNMAAIILALLGFIAPIQAFITSIPSCVFGGCAMILYGFIACSGIKMLRNVNLNIQKNLIIVSVVLSIGVSGIILGGSTLSFSGTALALIVGIILNFVLKEN